MNVIFKALSLGVLILASCAPFLLEQEHSNLNLRGVRVADEGQFPSVVNIRGRNPVDKLEEKAGWCTAVRIGPTTLLTAAHCVFDYLSLKPFYNYQSGTFYLRKGSVVEGVGSLIFLKRILLTDRYKNFVIGKSQEVKKIDPKKQRKWMINEIVKHEIPEIAVLESYFELPPGIEINKVTDQALHQGEKVFKLGYGSDFQHLDIFPKLELIWGDPNITGFLPKGVYAKTPHDNFVGALIPGDSGGPLFNEQKELIGINSFSFRTDHDNYDGHIRVDAEADGEVRSLVQTAINLKRKACWLTIDDQRGFLAATGIDLKNRNKFYLKYQIEQNKFSLQHINSEFRLDVDDDGNTFLPFFRPVCPR